MRRLLLINLLIFAVLAAAAGLAYYSYTFSSEMAARERAIIVDTMRELGEEKVYGIEREITDTDKKLLNAIPLHNPLEVQALVTSAQAPVLSVFVLDDELHVIPDGYFNKRPREEAEAFRTLFETRILPELPLRTARTGERGHIHAIYDGRSYLFAFTRRVDGGKPFYVVLETDLDYLIISVFPEYFDVPSPRLYRVVDDRGELVYGHDFAEEAVQNVVEQPFTESVSLWSLQVAQKDSGSLATRRRRQVVDAILIGVAMTVIVAGLAVFILAMRRAQRANELKSEFISNVSHELKTPLSIISMFGEMLATGRTRSPEQSTEYAEIIWRESVRLARLIDNVLDFAKIERGVDVYEFAEGDVGEVVQRALELSVHRLQKAEMGVEASYDEELPPLSIDANALTLAFLNLVDNAIKYASGGKKIEVGVRREAGRVVISVHDFGPGIEADEQERIFERFYRARSVRLKPIRGSGIGLALVKHIAEAHGGGVTVDSAPGQGATFRLWIPIEPA
jgi:two-component system, OmpR family, phosphate regulon sensor histidine kinase PhoR